jgi:DNA-binding NtrC family response regulator/polyferredoxin
MNVTDTVEETRKDNLAQLALLAHVRHEIRTPINAIIGYSEMLLEDAAVPEAAPDLERIHAAGKQLLALVDRLLSSSGAGEAQIDWDAIAVEIRHAMRTPVDTVLGYCELLRDDARDSGPDLFVADLEKIEISARRLLSFIDDLLQLVRQGAAEAVVSPGTSAVTDGIHKAVSGMVHSLRHRKASDSHEGPLGGSLLVADDNGVDRDLLVRRLKREGYAVTEAENGLQALELIKETNPDLVLLDVLMPEMNGFQVLDQLKSGRGLRSIPVIMLSSWDEAESVARCLEAGAEDYLAKPVNPVVLLSRIKGCIERKRNRDREISQLRQVEEDRANSYGELIGKHKGMVELRKQIALLAQADSPVLIQGERGTGKELAGRLIHKGGRRSDIPLLSIDCSGIAESPWGDKLLGDSRSGESGPQASQVVTYMDLVDGGTILLKNIEHLPMAVQERLARFLTADSMLPGQHRQDVRVIATCGSDPAGLVEAGLMQGALAEVLTRNLLVVPSLRQRKRDVLELATYFMGRCAQRLNKTVTGFEDPATTKLLTYDYPIMNVVELEKAVERAVSLTSDETIGVEEIFLGLPPAGQPQGINLLQLAPPKTLGFALRLFPGWVRVFAAAVFAVIMASCFVLPEKGGWHLGTLLVWSMWWPMLMVLYGLFGRIWCAICPMAFTGELLQRLVHPGQPRRIPGWMKEHDVFIPMVGFFLIMWTEAFTGMRHSPIATGFLLVAILTGAVVTSCLFPRRTWCRYLCPLGGFGGVCATTALLELRPTIDICSAKCKGHNCYTGGAGGVPGCPMSQHVMFVESNQNCVLCLNCVRNCPNGSPRLSLRWPASELRSGSGRHPMFGTFVLLLLGLLAAETLLHHWETVPNGLLTETVSWRRFEVVTALYLLASVPALVAAWWTKRAAGGGGGVLWKRVVVLTPLMTAGFLAFQLGFAPGLSDLLVRFGYHPLHGRGVDWEQVSVLAIMQIVVVFLGCLSTLFVVGSMRRARSGSVASTAAGEE